ncbi:ubiquinol-cytochrome-c reductase complex subunit-domain-containing protein [Xylariales sp. AK1849]|nr:ubiquinol-cytochrome-c reductase complex subunit-domain-containing protein [Xylariales sp. AK1849]
MSSKRRENEWSRRHDIEIQTTPEPGQMLIEISTDTITSPTSQDGLLSNWADFEGGSKLPWRTSNNSKEGKDIANGHHSGFKAGAFGGVALFAVIFYASGIPRVQRDILQKVPGLSSFFVKDVPASDNPF